MNRWLIIGAAVLAVLVAFFVFTGSDEMETVTEEAPAAVEGAVEEAGDAAEAGVEAVEEAVEDAAEATEEAVEDAGDAVEQEIDEPAAPAAPTAN